MNDCFGVSQPNENDQIYAAIDGFGTGLLDEGSSKLHFSGKVEHIDNDRVVYIDLYFEDRQFEKAKAFIVGSECDLRADLAFDASCFS